ncbi:MAG: phage recombination protein Bet [Lysobacter sp.]|nr:phage recombination protein Bet [Lysobacter sp.]
MSNALAKHETGLPALQMNEAELMEVLQSSLYPGAAPASIKMVLGYCKAAGLDPMQKPVHIVPMWDGKAKQMRDVVMPGIGLYRTQAARTGCAGVTEPEFGPDVTEVIGNVQITYPAWCRVTVKRRLASGDIVEFTAKEFWKENYAVKGGQEKSIAPNAMWQKRPYGQIAKCAEAQALRKAFPEIGSEPTADEMAGKSIHEYDVDATTGEVIQQKPAGRPALPDYSQADFDKNLPSWRKAVESGRMTPDGLIAMVSTKGVLSDAMKQAMRDLAKPQDVTDVQPKADAPAPQPATAGADDGDLPWND